MACGSPPPPPPPPPLPKFTCLTAPSGSYRAGTVIRTIDSGSAAAARVAPDELVIAYLPLGDPFRAGYGDFEQSAAAGATAALTGKVLERIGIKLDVSGNAAYAVVLTAKDNSDYMADDDLRTRTYSKVRDSDGLIAGARYFFVKEAVGSQNLSYVVTKNANVEAKAQLKADSSGLSTNVKFVDAVSKIAGEKRT